MSQLADKATLHVCLMVALLCVITQAWSDDSQPLYVEVSEVQTSDAQAGIAYQVKWRIPSTVKRDNAPVITLPAPCQNMTPTASRQGSAIQQRLYRCRSSLAGQPIGIRYTGYNPSISSLIKYRAVNGEEHTRLLSPSETSWTIPSAETKSRIARDYTLLGMQHIWAGTDHLLFLLCLLWIAGSWRRVLVTITGFTCAHSLTLVLSALQWVRLPVQIGRAHV